MIGRLEGRIVETIEGQILLDVAGVGYEIEMPTRAMQELFAPGESQVLHTHLVVREDSQRLFGFTQLLDRDIFRVLLRTDKVGPALALALLSRFTPAELTEYAHTDNRTALCEVSGVGMNTAERLCFNLKKKLSVDALVGTPAGHMSASADAIGESVAKTLVQQLGFKAADAKRLVQTSVQNDMSFEEALQAALKASGGQRT